MNASTNQRKSCKVRTLVIGLCIMTASLIMASPAAMAQEGGGNPQPHMEDPFCNHETTKTVDATYTNYYELCTSPPGQHTDTNEFFPPPSGVVFEENEPACATGYDDVQKHNDCGKPDPQAQSKCITVGNYYSERFRGGGCHYNIGVWTGTCDHWSQEQPFPYPIPHDNHDAVACVGQ